MAKPALGLFYHSVFSDAAEIPSFAAVPTGDAGALADFPGAHREEQGPCQLQAAGDWAGTPVFLPGSYLIDPHTKYLNALIR